ncbi:[protein-PII] uridylyltransferase [Nocardioides luteus]|uniref:Bifunctional uridylyltransferase/uridylyl-removing enzyme n=1 Tax=Nocardioides luteus TaxID=1844 RepID=A0ABQ5ST09_9ACTN|nr:[protein-PII] uridylyltransferase [Nocardioides luteus]MDR7309818.1 [protein-PII] uridylyltransferase [Nocardioides luteus]GGR72839.1 bifunctional uridylyltransferase/uridylyl-removing enzyme [Nocardioides luteus]GLJ67273.1 bifunctional uridylyltransferase/uridylyl-removing enzyme [Nocardioides luteus]
MTAEGRAERTADADDQCAKAYAAAGGPEIGVALVAVGGYGRGELAPFSDWDVVLVHDDDVSPGAVAEQVWYPLWDAAPRLDHSVRSFTEMLSASTGDLRVALGLLDVRHLAGDRGLVLRLRTTILAHWRKHARSLLPELRTMSVERHRRAGELAHASVPDLKEMYGGLRDAVVIKAIVATWLVDVPAVDLEKSRRAMLDVRDLVHEIAGRAGDRVVPEMWEQLAERLELPDARTAQAHVRTIGRRLTHLSRLAWRRVDGVLERSRPGAPRRPKLTPLGGGLALASGEVVLVPGARPARDPLMLLRASALAAENGVALAPPTAARLARDTPRLSEPWPEEARRLFVRLLGAGRGLLAVWETLEETGAVSRILPEWERIRLLPHASIIHRFTVDRHTIETCIEAVALLPRVARPDVLLVAALLHDIGKGSLTEHSVAGEPIARRVATRMGFPDDEVALISKLVRWHLLLSTTATTRDPDDPATVDLVVDTMGDAEALALLTALTEADARATSAQAWTSWRSRLIRDLAGRAARVLDTGIAAGERPQAEVEIPEGVRSGSASVRADFRAEPLADGARVRVIAPDRLGLLADLAATFAVARLPVRACRVWQQEGFAVSVWDLDDSYVDAAVLRTRFAAVTEGRLDPASRLAPSAAERKSEPSVEVRPEASDKATVLEVRTTDRPGVVYTVAAALVRMEIAVRSAHISTLGPQAVDVFYLQEAHAGALAEQRAAEAAHAVRAALE